MAGRKSRPPKNTLPAMVARPRDHSFRRLHGSPTLTVGDGGNWGRLFAEPLYIARASGSTTAP
jgi:hypothetical protein